MGSLGSLIPKMDEGYAIFSRGGLEDKQWLHRSNPGDCVDPGDVEVRVPGHELGRISDPHDRHQFEFCRLAVRHAVEWLDVFEAESEKADTAEVTVLASVDIANGSANERPITGQHGASRRPASGDQKRL